MMFFGREHGMYVQFFCLQCIKNSCNVKLWRICAFQLILSFMLVFTPLKISFILLFPDLFSLFLLTVAFSESYILTSSMCVEKKKVKKAVEELKPSLFLMRKSDFFFGNVHLKIPEFFVFTNWLFLLNIFLHCAAGACQ